MNGSSQLEEADHKPFALCPVCMRKISSYLGFAGDELQVYKELRDVFKLMNHKDQQDCFKREIKLFDRCITRIQALNASEHNNTINNVLSDNEGGHFEP